MVVSNNASEPPAETNGFLSVSNNAYALQSGHDIVKNSQSAISLKAEDGKVEGLPIVESFVAVPPDGGWGWVIVFASFMICMIVDGITYSFGILMPEFSNGLHISVESTALVGSLQVGAYLLIGPVVSGLINRFGAIPVVVLGSLISMVSFFVSYWANSLLWLMISFGVFGGIGCGLMCLPGIVYVSYYFERKRALATGLAVAGSGFGAFIFPPLTAALVVAFTWKGTMWILAGIAIQSSVFGCLLRSLPCPKAAIQVHEERKRLLSIASKTNAQSSDWTLNRDGQEGAFGFRRRKRTPTRTTTASGTSSGWVTPIPSRSPRMALRHPRLDTILASEPPPPIIGTPERLSRSSSRQNLQPTSLGAVEEESSKLNESDTFNGESFTPTNGSYLKSKSEENNLKESAVKTHLLATAMSTESNDSPSVKNGNTPLSNLIEGAVTFPLLDQNLDDPKDTLSTTGSPRFGRRSHRLNTETSLHPPFSRMTSKISRTSAPISRKLSHMSVRDFAESLSRMTSNNALNILSTDDSEGNLASIVDPMEFNKPFARQDIFLTGSIRNLDVYKRSGSNLKSYRESTISIPRAVEFYETEKPGELMPITEPFVEPSFWDCVPASVRSVIKQMVDVDLLAHPTMQLICLSNFFGFLAFYVPFVYLTSFAVETLGVTLTDASLFVSVIGITNTCGRVLCGWIADRGWIKAIYVNNIALLTCGFLTLVVPLCTTPFLLNVYSALFGFFTAAFICLTSIILVDHLGLKRLTNAFGLLILARGFACLIGSPLAGYIQMKTNSYGAAFVFSGSFIILSGLIGCLVPMVERSASFQRKFASSSSTSVLVSNNEKKISTTSANAVIDVVRQNDSTKMAYKTYNVVRRSDSDASSEVDKYAGPGGNQRRLDDIMEALTEYEMSLGSKTGAKLLQDSKAWREQQESRQRVL